MGDLHMFRLVGEQLQIIRVVVQRIFVFVMHYFFASQRTSDLVFHYYASKDRLGPVSPLHHRPPSLRDPDATPVSLLMSVTRNISHCSALDMVSLSIGFLCNGCGFPTTALAQAAWVRAKREVLLMFALIVTLDESMGLTLDPTKRCARAISYGREQTAPTLA